MAQRVHIVIHIAVAASASVSGVTLFGTSRLGDHSLIAVAQGCDHFLRQQDFTASGALLALGQAGLSAGRILTGDGFLAVAQRVHPVNKLTVTTENADVLSVANLRAGRGGHYCFIVVRWQSGNSDTRFSEAADDTDVSNIARFEASRWCHQFLIHMAKGRHDFLRHQDFTASGALLTLGQAGLGAGCVLTGKNFLAVAQRIYIVIHIAVVALGASISSVSTLGAGGCGHNCFRGVCMIAFGHDYRNRSVILAVIVADPHQLGAGGQEEVAHHIVLHHIAVKGNRQEALVKGVIHHILQICSVIRFVAKGNADSGIFPVQQIFRDPFVFFRTGHVQHNALAVVVQIIGRLGQRIAPFILFCVGIGNPAIGDLTALADFLCIGQGIAGHGVGLGLCGDGACIVAEIHLVLVVACNTTSHSRNGTIFRSSLVDAHIGMVNAINDLGFKVIEARDATGKDGILRDVQFQGLTDISFGNIARRIIFGVAKIPQAKKALSSSVFHITIDRNCSFVCATIIGDTCFPISKDNLIKTIIRISKDIFAFAVRAIHFTRSYKPVTIFPLPVLITQIPLQTNPVGGSL